MSNLSCNYARRTDAADCRITTGVVPDSSWRVIFLPSRSSSTPQRHSSGSFSTTTENFRCASRRTSGEEATEGLLCWGVILALS